MYQNEKWKQIELLFYDRGNILHVSGEWHDNYLALYYETVEAMRSPWRGVNGDSDMRKLKGSQASYRSKIVFR